MQNLLNPTLSPETSHQRIYSQRALFFVAFFGGPLALLLLNALNSNKLNRLRRDLLPYLIALSLYVALLSVIIWSAPEGVSVWKWIAAQRRENFFFKYAPRIFALILWGGFAFLHRPFHKAAQLLGDDPPSPWRAALSCFAVAMVADIALMYGLISIRI
jgi:hypothetical protein